MELYMRLKILTKNNIYNFNVSIRGSVFESLFNKNTSGGDQTFHTPRITR